MNMRMMATSIAALLWVGACGDSESKGDTTTTSTSDTTSTTDTATTTDTTSDPNTSSITGVTKPANPKPEPTPDPACAANENNPDYAATSGFKYPWEGIEIGDADFTCNGCKTGDPRLQGKWRVHGFVNPDGTGDMDYDFPNPATDYAETLFVDGNTFEVHLKDAKAPSGQQEGVYRGFYFCSEMPQQPGAHLFWIVTDSDMGSTEPGDIFESDVGQGAQGSASNILIYWYDEVGSTQNKDYQYCKLGTKNPDNNAQTCTNPFE